MVCVREHCACVRVSVCVCICGMCWIYEWILCDAYVSMCVCVCMYVTVHGVYVMCDVC